MVYAVHPTGQTDSGKKIRVWDIHELYWVLHLSHAKGHITRLYI